jgi:hypothetical protein
MAFTVTYNSNGATGGSVPVDPGSYATGALVTVLGNTGTLSKAGDTFARWNAQADGSGAPYGWPAATTFSMGTSDVTLYAQWYTTSGLTDSGQGPGVTDHFAFAYDSSLQAAGLEPARTNAVIAACEGDYQLMSGWFDGIALNSVMTVPIPCFAANLSGGANTTNEITLKPGSNDAAYVRYLIVSEVTEVFMNAQNKGWFAPDGSNEQSVGEGLSRFLAQQFLVLTGLGVSEPGYAISPHWLNSSLPPGTPGSTQLGALTTLTSAIDAAVTAIPVANATTIPFASTYVAQIDNEQMLVSSANTAAKTLAVTRGYNGTTAASHAANANVSHNYGARTDYINLTLEYDHGIDAATGCAMLFLYYLNVQLGFSIDAIIAAAPGSSQAANCLRGVYRNLTGDDSDPFPLFKRLLDAAFAPTQEANVPGPNPDNPWPLGLLSFWGEKDTWGHDEVNDILVSSGGVYPKGFWLMLEGFNRQVVGSATPSSPTVSFAGTSTALDPSGIAFESSNLLAPQRIRYPYDVEFLASVLPAFPASGETPAVVKTSITLLGASFPAESEFFFIHGADPYFTNVAPNPNPSDENAPYLSADLRVFTAVPGHDQHPVLGAPAFSTDNVSGAYSYIQSLIGWLNEHHGDPSQPDPFDPASNVIPGQQDALTGDSSVTPWTLINGTRYTNYNFAVARVRLRGTAGPDGAASGVKVFFRLWGTQTADTDWDPGYTYLSHRQGGNPVWPLAPSDNHTVPFFATSNAPDLSDAGNPEYGTAGVNNQTITILQSDKQWAYFGCLLNLYDAGFVVNGQEVRRAFAGTHHCLVAEIAYADAPIRSVGGVVVTPETSSQLAQRNLQVTPSDNPGPASAHLIPQTFDTRLSALRESRDGVLGHPDELMIDWGDIPVGCEAQIYWPAVPSADVLTLAEHLYAIQSLSAADAHTVRCQTTDGVTYVPIPSGTGASLAGLFTVQLPRTVVAGQVFNIVVRRIGTRQLRAIPAPAPPSPRAAAAQRRPGAAVARVNEVIVERYVVGSFQIKIPVKAPAALLGAEETTLAILKARFDAMAGTDRWYPVLKRYLDYVADRVDGLGGHPSEIPPSFDGAPIGVLSDGGSGRRPGYGDGRRGEARELGHTGKVCGLIFDHFGDFEGFLLDGGERERRYGSRERAVRDLVQRAWRERLRVTVYSEPDESRRIRAVVVHEPPAAIGAAGRPPAP